MTVIVMTPNCKKKMKLSRPKIIVSREWQLILLFASMKLLLHFFTFSNFELHRDAYLYYAQSEHLSWGYVAVPPAIAVIGKIATLIFGYTTFGLRFFPALIGGINLIIIGLAVKELGGNKIAISLASLAYLLSPSYLHTNALFQPVPFNHFYWLLSGYLILVMIKRNNPKMWMWIAVIFGLAFLNKYSIVFFYTAFAISLLISRYRYLFLSKYFSIALVIGLIIVFPNLIWQYQNNWPVLFHMAELRETQLVHVRLSDFILGQFLMNLQALLLWLPALLVLLFYKKEKQYRLFGFIYLFLIILLLFGSGKAYYTLGIYPILFVFGAYFIEKYIKKYLIYVFSSLVISMFFFLYLSLPYDGIPIITFEKAVNKDAFRWEDGVYHDIPQDMADMTGWKEIGQKVGDIYLSLDQ
jgi:4-amino-4-deoxy-L-arabinose transferase-like glycosyltransferase